jgi:DNA-binding HxlR family transcriptional regulator
MAADSLGLPAWILARLERAPQATGHLHAALPGVPVDELHDALEQLRRDGLIHVVDRGRWELQEVQQP